MKTLFSIILGLMLVLVGLGQEPAPRPTSQIIFGNKHTKIYWVGDCGEKFTIANSLWVNFASEKEALDNGYKKSEKCTILEKVKPISNKLAFYAGNKKTFTFYKLRCLEAVIKAEDLITFETKEEAEKLGFVEGEKCTSSGAKNTGVTKRKPIGLNTPTTILSKLALHTDDYFGKILYIRGNISEFDRIIADGCFKDDFDLGQVIAFKLAMVSDTSNFGNFILMIDDEDVDLLRAIYQRDGVIHGTFKIIFSQKLRNNCFGLELIGYRLD